jgi:hypothetical protein
MITLRRAADRGRFDFGWLDIRHTLSFGDYYDPKHMEHKAFPEPERRGALRLIASAHARIYDE